MHSVLYNVDTSAVCVMVVIPVCVVRAFVGSNPDVWVPHSLCVAYTERLVRGRNVTIDGTSKVLLV